MHAAFADPAVAAIMTVIGGYNSNELLPYLDWDLIRANPKVFCGYSDITALQGAMLARAGLVTYYGPHWSTFGMARHCEQTAGMVHGLPAARRPGRAGSRPRPGPMTCGSSTRISARYCPVTAGGRCRPGRAQGRIVGGNLCTLNLLQGKPYLPSLADAVLFIEDDFESQPPTFARNLTSLLQLPGAAGLRGLVIGRFQRDSNMTRSLLEQIIAGQPGLAGLPVLANVDIGHTNPIATVPLGGQAAISAAARRPERCPGPALSCRGRPRAARRLRCPARPAG